MTHGQFLHALDVLVLSLMSGACVQPADLRPFRTGSVRTSAHGDVNLFLPIGSLPLVDLTSIGSVTYQLLIIQRASPQLSV